MFAAAKIVGEIFLRLKQPVVIGELLAGALIGAHGLGLVTASPVTDAIAELGVIMLLFMVGLETRIEDLVAVGKPSILVGIFGVIVPLAIGFGGFVAIGYKITPALFMGTAMVATSIGITARVLGDLGLIKHKVSRIILGAAILDDVLGLIILALVSNLGQPGFNYAEFAVLIVEAALFILFLTTLGPRLAGKHYRSLTRFKQHDATFAAAIVLVLGFSVLAEYIGLAAIIGAFLAGIVLSEVKEFYHVEQEFKPLAGFLVPFFFVVMGTKFDVIGLLQPQNLALLAFTMFLAVIGKMIGSAVGTYQLGFKTMLRTGIGMIPRGEVGIVVGTLGLSVGVIDQNLYGIVLGMSILTTVIVPPMLTRAFKSET